MKKTIFCAVNFLILGINLNVNAQVTQLDNVSPIGTPFLGWDNTGLSRSLDIRNDFTNQPITFFTSNGTPTERMRLTQTGFLGLGTNAPSSFFHLNTTTTGSLFRTDGLSTNSNQWQLFTDNEKFRLSVPASSSNVNLSVVQNANMLFSTNNFSRALFNGGTGVNSGRFALGNNIPATFTPLDRLHLHQDALSGVFMRFTYQGLANSAGTQLGIVGATGLGTSGN